MPNKCSPLASALYDLARAHVAINPGIDIDGIVDEISAAIPGVNRQRMVDSILQVTQSNKRTVTDFQKRLARIKYEARRDKALTEQIDLLNQHLENGTIPPPSIAKKVTRPQAIEKMTQIRNDLMRQLNKSEPSIRRKYEKQIQDSLDKLSDGTWRGLDPKADELAGLEKNEELQKLRVRRDKLRDEVRRKIGRLRHKSEHPLKRALNHLNSSKALQATGELSMIMNQGGYMISHPFKVAKAVEETVKSMASEDYAYRIMHDLEQSPNFAKWRRLTSLGIQGVDTPMSQREAEIQSTWSNISSGPFKYVGKFQRVFDRGYMAYLNRMRYSLAESMGSWAKGGDPSIEEMRQIAGAVNAFTGRGDLGALEKYSEALNAGLFSPRYQMSKLQLLTGQPLWQGEWKGFKSDDGKWQAPYELLGSSEIRKQILLQHYGSALASMFGMYMLWGAAAMDDAENEEFWKPLSGKFMQLPMGNNLYLDPTSGLASMATAINRVGRRKTMSRGEVVPLSEGYSDIVVQYFKGRRSTGLGAMWDWMSGKDFNGDPTSLVSVAQETVTPITYGEMAEVAHNEMGVPRSWAIQFAMILGSRFSVWDNDTKDDEPWWSEMGLTY